ncbi:FlgD immunoglobulin-like domain containing protein, partial [Candidatus Neomarinimicrobiota bacterium]
TDIPLTGEQTLNAVFDTALNSNGSTLLFHEPTSFSVPRGLGVWHDPPAGGAFRSDGGQFVFISGRPYRYDAEQLRANVEFILEYLLHEPGSQGDGQATRIVLEQNYPNPFTLYTTIEYALPRPARVSLKVYDILGKVVATLIDEPQDMDYRQVEWHGRDQDGRAVASGIYFAVYKAEDVIRVRKMVLLK